MMSKPGSWVVNDKGELEPNLADEAMRARAEAEAKEKAKAPKPASPAGGKEK